MFKKIVIVSAILAASSSLAFADGVPYVGADIGLDSNSFKLKNPAGNSTNFSSHGVNGGLLAGYGATVNQNVYLGGEVFANTGSFGSSTKVIDNAGTTAKFTSKYSYGVSFIPGYKVTPSTMVYGRLGVVRTRFELTQNPTPAWNSPSTTGDTITGGQLGLGVQTALNSNVDVRGEVVHSNYKSYTAFNNKITPTNNQFNLGLVYKFS